MTLSTRERELAAIGASIGAGCAPCLDYHLRAAREAEVGEDALRDAIAVGERVRENAGKQEGACGCRDQRPASVSCPM